jgi:hypothetical protein
MRSSEADRARTRRNYLDPKYREWKREYNRQYRERQKQVRAVRATAPAGHYDCDGRYHIGL